ncbi:2-polyprenylphenol 6-hydroxylase [Chromobacterium violaceum]|uniref:2-polyprenylphenol 6-hydroxylase n=1 Tax=Chromobacterium violaceum TaxID=536 RepID=A0A3S5DLP4_CHRVL|nr:2-polyprenylphenol 6-hydroxylase [Chromobacterium violaceum]
MALIRNHGIVLPPDMAMLFKALVTLEGLGRQLNPISSWSPTSPPSSRN